MRSAAAASRRPPVSCGARRWIRGWFPCTLRLRRCSRPRPRAQRTLGRIAIGTPAIGRVAVSSRGLIRRARAATDKFGTAKWRRRAARHNATRPFQLHAAVSRHSAFRVHASIGVHARVLRASRARCTSCADLSRYRQDISAHRRWGRACTAPRVVRHLELPKRCFGRRSRYRHNGYRHWRSGEREWPCCVRCWCRP